VATLMAWLRRRPTEAWVTALLVAGSAAFVFVQLHPELLLADTTAAGGDMGAHVWAPAYLREHLLPNLRLSGWTPDWYAGFPVYVFYMVVPSLLIVLLDVFLFLDYNVAFKLVSVSGLVLLPVAAWAFGRLTRLPFPYPAVLAVATVPFVFDRSFSIYGGNAASTLAGEFAFSISLAFSLVFLGLVHRGLDTGRNRALAAVLLALTVTCHLIPAIFALIAAVVILAFSIRWTWLGLSIGIAVAGCAVVFVTLLLPLVPLVVLVALGLVLVGAGARFWSQREVVLGAFGANRLRYWWFVSAIGAGSLLTSFWALPFYANRKYMTDMGWEKITNYLQLLFPGRIGDRFAHLWNGVNTALGGTSHHVVDGAVKMAGSEVPADMTWVIALAAVGVGTSIAFRRRFGLWLTATAGVLAVAVAVAPQGRLWNARLLPFWYLLLYFLAAVAVVELVSAVAVLVSRDGNPRRGVHLAGPVLAAAITAAAVAFPLWSLPLGNASATEGTYSWLFWKSRDHSFVPSWARWNYEGYERKDAYGEYVDVVTTMEGVGEERGCGRAMWEYEKELDRFGTPMALMLLPYWTEGCIGSMEGLYFEASATTPFHFLNQSELSAVPSRAQRELDYGNLDIDLGVRHLQLLGVKYYMAFSPAAVAAAEENADLTEVAATGKWHVYEVADAELVEALPNAPAVVEGVDVGGRTWQDMAEYWYLRPDRWGVLRAADGPDDWQRIDEGATPDETPQPEVTVSDIEATDDAIRFTVDRPGVPVLVKASYFPNWKASGAEGPYRVAPNLMVVVPTDDEVTLRYGRTGIDWLSILFTLGGIGAVVVLGRRRLVLGTPEEPVVDEPTDDVDLVAASEPVGDDKRWDPPAG
jgi:hypothetical protein